MPERDFRRDRHTAQSNIVLVWRHDAGKGVGRSEDLSRVSVVPVKIKLSIQDPPDGTDASMRPLKGPGIVERLASIANNDEVAVFR
jgi:hypothetical protein